MRCKNCGWENPDNNSKCSKCNAPITVTEVNRIAPTTGFNPGETVRGCPVCGYPVKPGDKSCPECGQQLGGGNRNDNHPDDKESKPFKETVISGANSGEKKLAGFLVSYSHSASGKFYPLYEGKNLLGRDNSNNIPIAEDPNVSRLHIVIRYRAVDGKFKLKDESTNGTWVNDILVDEEEELKNGDIITVGATQLIFIAVPDKTPNPQKGEIINT